MDYEKLESKVDEVRQAARAAAAVYLGPYASPEAGPAPQATASPGEPASVLDDPKVKAALQVALRNPALFAAPPEEIYDLNGSLLFREFVFPLDGGVEVRVRTGANKALGALIVSVSVAQPWDQQAAVKAAAARAAETGVGRPRQPVQVICYAYPRLGIVLEGGSRGPLVMDLMDGEAHPLSGDAAEGFWWPYDGLAPGVAERAAARFSQEKEALTEAPPSTLGTSEPLGLESSAGKLEHTIGLHLIVQERQNFCAPAASAMILRHHGMAELDQHKIARKFAEAASGDPEENLERMRFEGTPPLDQHKGLNDICRGRGLVAEILFSDQVQGDWNRVVPRILDELKHDRPVQRQLKMPHHVDVFAGWRGMAGTDDLMLLIYDPAGDARFHRWAQVSSNINDLIFVHPAAAT